MQTFLPYPNFISTARCLDDKRLGKQRIEALQIYKSLTIPSYGWKAHPAVKMWRNYTQALVNYGLAICNEWTSRGFKDSLTPFFHNLYKPDPDIPKWMGDEAFHAAHRSNLLRKDPFYYGAFGWKEPSTLPYIWPN